MENKIELYNQRLMDCKNTCNHIEPKYVPVVGYYLTWAVGYAGMKTDDLLDNPDLIADAYRKAYDDVYADFSWGGLTTPIRALQKLGSDAFFVSEDGHTIQHKEHCAMNADDYDSLLEEPMYFLMDVLGKRKFPVLNNSKAEVKKALIDVMRYVQKFNAGNAKLTQMLKNEYGVPQLFDGGKVYPPMDVLFDRLRGFQGSLTDLRRNRERVKAALEILDKIYKPLTYSAGTGETFAISTLHCPTYLNLKDFKEIFWPYMRDYCLEVYNRGSKTFLVMEGSWNRFYNLMMDELPKDSVVCVLDADNTIESYKIIGDYFPILGGVTASDIKYNSKQQCLDAAKKMIDECAPGGGFIWSIDKALISASDVNPENLIAVNQFVHEYGKY